VLGSAALSVALLASSISTQRTNDTDHHNNADTPRDTMGSIGS